MSLIPLLLSCATTPAPSVPAVFCEGHGSVMSRGENLVLTKTPCNIDPEAGWPLTGVIVDKKPGILVVNHDPIPGLMGAMTMDLNLPQGVTAPDRGSRVRARLYRHDDRFWLGAIHETGFEEIELRDDIQPVEVGEIWPAIEGTTEQGTPFRFEGPTVLSFIYTRCPNPEFCPALVGRLLSLQEQLPEGARIVTVSLDPEYDVPEVLAAYKKAVGAGDSWTLVHTTPEEVQRLALLAGQQVLRESGVIRHSHRLIVLDAERRVLERYDHNRWPIGRIRSQLAEGRPIGLHP